MKVLAGSQNPVKIQAVQDVFAPHFPGVEVIGVPVESGVPAQPVGEETFAGAENRARARVAHNAAEGLGASFCVGLEGGISQLHGRWFAFGVLCIADAGGRLGFGVSPLFELPPGITAELLAGGHVGGGHVGGGHVGGGHVGGGHVGGGHGGPARTVGAIPPRSPRCGVAPLGC